MKRPISLSLAAVLLAAGSFTAALPALADDDRRDRRGWHSDRDGRDDRRDRRSDRRDWRSDDRRADRRDWRRDDREYRYDRYHRDDRRRVVHRPVVVHQHPVVYHARPVVRYERPRYASGYHYGHHGYGPSYVVNDYRGYGLRHPPRGYGWRRSDAGDFLLVALATGIIAEVIFGH